ncbi:hypothetical protein ElyMa_006253900 [Elysia marginata]|uniref:Uncharacterized protein n=1 Tax=Elysia marginata TaxID=1093978 RepID=A0AAV4HCR4_9GAST|nr:hypothetical protein ElyMa_006253900 [Elysia marginata]
MKETEFTDSRTPAKPPIDQLERGHQAGEGSPGLDNQPDREGLGWGQLSSLVATVIKSLSAVAASRYPIYSSPSHHRLGSGTREQENQGHKTTRNPDTRTPESQKNQARVRSDQAWPPG